MRHRICVFVVILEIDFVLYTGLDVSEETEVDYETSIDGLGNRTVGESVTMDLRNGSISQGLTNNSWSIYLRVPRVLLGERSRDLRLGISERDMDWVSRVTFLVMGHHLRPPRKSERMFVDRFDKLLI